MQSHSSPNDVNRAPAPPSRILPDGFDGKTACCFSGHRPPGLPDGGNERSAGMLRLKFLLIHAVEDAIMRGVTTFLAGGAAGFDTLAAEAALVWREFYPSVRLVLALPGRNQAAGFDAPMRARYERILAAANEVHYASDDCLRAYALLSRNRYLVDHADCCIAYLNSASGGTLYTVNYALNAGIPVYNLAHTDKS